MFTHLGQEDKARKGREWKKRDGRGKRVEGRSMEIWTPSAKSCVASPL